MVKMTKDKVEYDIAESRVEKLLKRGFALVTDTPEPKDVVKDQVDLEINQGDL